MSESVTFPPKRTATQAAPSTDHALGQVEKWMAIIREINPRSRSVETDANTALLRSRDNGE